MKRVLVGLFGSLFVAMSVQAMAPSQEFNSVLLVDSEVKFFGAVKDCSNFLQSIEGVHNRRVVDVGDDVCIIATQKGGDVTRCHVSKDDAFRVGSGVTEALGQYRDEVVRGDAVASYETAMGEYRNLTNDPVHCEQTDKSIWSNH